MQQSCLRINVKHKCLCTVCCKLTSIVQLSASIVCQTLCSHQPIYIYLFFDLILYCKHVYKTCCCLTTWNHVASWTGFLHCKQHYSTWFGILFNWLTGCCCTYQLNTFQSLWNSVVQPVGNLRDVTKKSLQLSKSCFVVFLAKLSALVIVPSVQSITCFCYLKMLSYMGNRCPGFAPNWCSL